MKYRIRSTKRIRWCRITERWVAEPSAFVTETASGRFVADVTLKTADFITRREAEDYCAKLFAPDVVGQWLPTAISAF
jgi:hypothetical protein